MKRPVLSTERRSILPDRRMTPEHRRTLLLEMGFTHVVIRLGGKMEAAFSDKADATQFADRLIRLYGCLNAVTVEQLS